MPAKRNASPKDASSATIGFEANLWHTADKLHNKVDAAEMSRARQIAKGNPQGERGGVDQFGIPPKGNANFFLGAALHPPPRGQGMAGFDLANGMN